jgi:1,4-dihydroxy-2-naphthoate octaprenyltransferase
MSPRPGFALADARNEVASTMSSQGGPRVWAQAFVGFYRTQDTSARELDPIARFLFSARSVILVISAQAALIAGLLALAARRFDALSFVLVLVGFLDAHAISNLSNDYFGYRRGHDTPDSPRLRYTVHPLASGMLTPRMLATGLALLGLGGVAIIAYFVALRGPLTLAFAGAGVALLFLYDASPVTLKSIGLGEIASFLVWGPLMVGGGYFAITGQLGTAAFLVSVPYGLGVASILVGKHIDQRPFDAAHGQRTLPVVLGDRGARVLNRVLVAGMYVVVVVLVVARIVSPLALIVAVALPRAVRAIELMGRPRPSEPLAGYVGWPLWYHRACLSHNRLFGWLYISGLAAGALVALWIAP